MLVDFEFACQDNCLELMVPSDLRQVVAERDQLRAELQALKGGAVPSAGLYARCAEILEWQKSGVLSGSALRDYASKSRYAGDHNDLQIAESDTAREAYAFVVDCFNLHTCGACVVDEMGAFDDWCEEEMGTPAPEIIGCDGDDLRAAYLAGMARQARAAAPQPAEKAQEVQQDPHETWLANPGDCPFPGGLPMGTAPQPAQDVSGLVSAIEEALPLIQYDNSAVFDDLSEALAAHRAKEGGE